MKKVMFEKTKKQRARRNTVKLNLMISLGGINE